MASPTKRWSRQGLRIACATVFTTALLAELGREAASPSLPGASIAATMLMCLPLMLAAAVLWPIGERVGRFAPSRGDGWWALVAVVFAAWPLVPGLGFPVPTGSPLVSVRTRALLPFAAVAMASCLVFARHVAVERARRKFAWRQRAWRTRSPVHRVLDSLQRIAAAAPHDPATVQHTAILLAQWQQAAAVERADEQRTLRDELAMLQPYLELQRLRFGGRADLIVDVPTELLAARMPDALLLPLVEHAIERAIAPRGAGWLRVTARPDGRWLVLEIADDGSPPVHEGEPKDADSVPAATIRQARELAVPEGWIELRRNERGGTSTWVRLPLAFVGQMV
jgi:hypothetical protein